MNETATFASALNAAAAEHTWGSHWTSDGENSKELSAWKGSVSETDTYQFSFEGTRVIRRGADIQDYKVFLYLADVRCDSCGKFLQRDSTERSAQTIVTAKLCIGCLSGGLINKSMFR